MTTTTTPQTIETTTRTIDGVEFEVDTAECIHCGEPIARANQRGMRAWRHTDTINGMCQSGESVADPR